MLINKMGVETDDEIVELNTRRESADPRNRETTTMLLQVALSAVKRSEYEGTVVAPTVPVATLTTTGTAATLSVSTPADETRTDAA
ncbi:MAG: hypothetical protein HIU57_01795 [Acidobacteria bacterium]|nr:hypothetical protein [Acidobacteriota bacterium]